MDTERYSKIFGPIYSFAKIFFDIFWFESILIFISDVFILTNIFRFFILPLSMVMSIFGNSFVQINYICHTLVWGFIGVVGLYWGRCWLPTLSLPWKNAFWELSLPVIRSTRSLSEMVSVTSGLAGKSSNQ